MSEPARCPRAKRRQIETTFLTLCRAHRVRPKKTAHPRAVDDVWSLAGGHLGKIKSGCERVIRRAAALGYFELELTAVAHRWGA